MLSLRPRPAGQCPCSHSTCSCPSAKAAPHCPRVPSCRCCAILSAAPLAPLVPLLCHLHWPPLKPHCSAPCVFVQLLCRPPARWCLVSSQRELCAAAGAGRHPGRSVVPSPVMLLRCQPHRPLPYPLSPCRSCAQVVPRCPLMHLCCAAHAPGAQSTRGPPVCCRTPGGCPATIPCRQLVAGASASASPPTHACWSLAGR